MDLLHIQKKILKKIEMHGINSPFALALVGSRAAGYYKKSSDYDFNAIFKNSQKNTYLNFNIDHTQISVKLQGKNKFEKSIKNKNSSERLRFIIMPYSSIDNPEYFNINENIGRKKTIEELTKLLPQGKDIIINIKNIVEFPLISRSISFPGYTGRARRILKNKEFFMTNMIKRYYKFLKNEGYFISSNNEIKLKNENYPESININLSEFIKNRYNLGKEIGAKNRHYLEGGLIVVLQSPILFFNNFEKIPQIKKIENKYFYNGPTLEKFLKKREIFIPIEKATNFLKNKLTKDIFKETNLYKTSIS